MKLYQKYSENEKASDILIKMFEGYSTVKRLQKLYRIFSAEDVLVTSSFGSNAAYLLHLISRINPGQKIHFIDTGFHFKETLEYKRELIKWLNLNVVEIHPEHDDHTYSKKNKLWQNNPDLCCHLNKTKPFAKTKNNFKVWISGLIKSQSDFRSSLRLFEDNSEVIKFHPLYDLEYSEIEKYVKYFNIPPHPMVGGGYESIGCTHCTAQGKGRSGRWSGKSKTECGLHINDFEKDIQKQKKVEVLEVNQG